MLILRDSILSAWCQIRIVPSRVRGVAHTRLALRYNVGQDEATRRGLKALADGQRLRSSSGCRWTSWAHNSLRLRVNVGVLFINPKISALAL